jgi:hypothetical protein
MEGDLEVTDQANQIVRSFQEFLDDEVSEIYLMVVRRTSVPRKDRVCESEPRAKL